MKYSNNFPLIALLTLVLLIFCNARFSNNDLALSKNGASPLHYQWEQVLPFGNGSFQEKWKPGTFPLGLEPRVAFGGDLWMIGQKSAWSSRDGINWTQHKKQDWGERIWMSYAYFNNKLWMFGGMKYHEKQTVNDSWSSADGLHWEQVANHAEWSPRKEHTVIAFKDKLWLFSGSTDVSSDFTAKKLLNDIWSSKDGVHWTKELEEAPWVQRDHPNMVVFKEELYMLGGQGKSDIWSSTDGKNWTQLYSEAPWGNRSDNGVLIFDNQLWIFGGRDTSINHHTAAKNDVWFSDNGSQWRKQTEHAPWTVRSGGMSVVFNNKLWIYSGKHTGGEYNWGGDVWTMSRDK
ncbi:MAG: hypothetical protein R2822_22340 [Spirosomataceae bacterium]